MAARLHSKMRNHLRKRRYANPLEIDEDVSASLLAWKFGEEDTPTFYDKVRQRRGEDDIISEAGEEWLLQNKALADQFLQDSLSSTSTSSSSSSPSKQDRYSRLFDDDLKRNACYPIWPKGAEGMLPPLVWLWSFWYRESMVWAFRIFWLLVVSHLFEAILVILWLTPVGFTYTAQFAWAVYAFFCGWPVTGRAKILSNIILKNNETQEIKRLKKTL